MWAVMRVARLARDHRADVGRELAPDRRPRARPSRPSASSSMRSATSSCRHSTRSAEQRWPALNRTPRRCTSATTCSASAEESTIIAFCPPVSAISGTGAPRRSGGRRARAGSAARPSVEPVNTTPARAGRRPAPRRPRPSPGSSCSASRGTPASCSSAHGLRRRSAASPRRAWRAPRCRRPARPRPGR